jgi:hypothetical protein
VQLGDGGLETRPTLDIGRLGAFDDAGGMPSCLVEADGRLYLYYTGWTLGETYRVYTADSADGLAWEGDPDPLLDVAAASWDSEMVCYASELTWEIAISCSTTAMPTAAMDSAPPNRKPRCKRLAG